jgi:formate hydrogenlyase subunit 6/NADH:ubiquinone oxidoreductase subunit I
MPSSRAGVQILPAENTREAPSRQRRKVLTGLATGAAVLPLMRATTSFTAEKNERRIRPPGALEESDFLARCVRCGEFVKACPNNALHPALSEAGLEGVWTPVLVPRIGYCEPSCVLCSEACPTGAIWEITSKAKAGSSTFPAIASPFVSAQPSTIAAAACLGPWLPNASSAKSRAPLPRELSIFSPQTSSTRKVNRKL